MHFLMPAEILVNGEKMDNKNECEYCGKSLGAPFGQAIDGYNYTPPYCECTKQMLDGQHYLDHKHWDLNDQDTGLLMALNRCVTTLSYYANQSKWGTDDGSYAQKTLEEMQKLSTTAR